MPDLSPHLKALVAGQQRHYFRKNAIFLSEGQLDNSIHIILDGRVKVFASNANGREIVLAFQEAGDYLGEMTLDGGTRSASAIAVRPTTCVIVTRDQLQRYIGAHPEFAFELISKVIGIARRATLTLKNLALLDSYGRVARLLTSKATEKGSAGMSIPDSLTHQDIADQVGCGREMVSRIMKELVAGNYIKTERRIITILRPLPAHR